MYRINLLSACNFWIKFVFVRECLPWFASGSNWMYWALFYIIDKICIFHVPNKCIWGCWLINIISYFLDMGECPMFLLLNKHIFWILHIDGLHFFWFSNIVVQIRFTPLFIFNYWSHLTRLPRYIHISMQIETLYCKKTPQSILTQVHMYYRLHKATVKCSEMVCSCTCAPC